METDFDFKPINEGLGFHRKVKPLDVEADSDESFSFSTLGPGTLGQPAVDSNSREQSKGLLSSGATTSSGAAAATSVAKKKHNAKSVSDLIAALPPSLDFLLDEPVVAKPTTSAANNGAGATAGRKSPLFSSPSGIATPGTPAAASVAAQEAKDSKAEAKSDSKRGFIKMPIGRSDYGLKAAKSAAGAVAAPAARAPSSLDENVAKTFPTVFPHLGSLAGQPAAASVKAAAKTTSVEMERSEERVLSTHFGSAILDTLVAVGLGCVMLAVALSITNVNLLALLENSQTDRQTISALALLFVAGGLLYVLAARSFVGATLGEWSYEIRVGDSRARSRWFYPVLVMWRGILVAATGFVLFPLVSLIAGTDVLKYLTGLQLVSSTGRATNEFNETAEQ